LHIKALGDSRLWGGECKASELTLPTTFYKLFKRIGC
jgi:hypothetical protein